MAVTISGSSPTFSSGYQGGTIISGTAQNSTSGTSIDFTGIPSWVKRVTVIFNQVSSNGSSITQIQLGTSGGIVTSGYLGNNGQINAGTGQAAITTGHGLCSSQAASFSYNGHVVFTLLGSNIWVGSGVLSYANG